MRADPKRITLLLGGRRGEGLSEARAGFEHIRELKPPAGARILLEEGSRDTLENLRNARQDLSELKAGSVVLLSSRYHLARCSRIATSLGLHHRLCAADPTLRIDLKIGLRLLLEAFYCTWFYTGRGWAKVTRNQRMWNRIS